MRYLRHSPTVVGILVLTAIGLQAHGALLTIDKEAAAPGEAITVNGEGLSDGGEVVLTLQGILQDYGLGVVEKTDEHGVFEHRVTLSTDLRAGEYTLVASGTETATAKLTIIEVVAAVAAPVAPVGVGPVGEEAHEALAGVGESAHDSAAEAAELASAEPMEIERSNRGLERTLAWGSVLLATIAGFGLLLWDPRKDG
ncbi:MAG: hypothetical protein V3W06_04685 [Acidimicrobiia bacterium]